MSRTTRVIDCPPEAVFAVFANGWFFPAWVVGASRMRSVDPDWPHRGAQLHHSFGAWPLVIDDVTTVLQWDPPHSFVIQPKGWPIGEARVRMEVEPHGTGTRVRMYEKAVRGPGTLVPALVMEPMLWIRNIEALRRLAHLAEGRAGGRDVPTDAEPVPDDRVLGLPRRGRRLLPLLLAAATTVLGVVAVRRSGRR